MRRPSRAVVMLSPGSSGSAHPTVSTRARGQPPPRSLRSPSKRKCSRHFVQAPPAFAMIRYELRDVGPEAGLVMPVPQVDKFVHYHVFEEFRASHNQPPVESQRPIRAAASPAALLFPDEHRPGDETGAKRPICGHRCEDRKSTRLNSSHSQISYAVFCLKKKNNKKIHDHRNTPHH